MNARRLLVALTLIATSAICVWLLVAGDGPPPVESFGGGATRADVAATAAGGEVDDAAPRGGGDADADADAAAEQRSRAAAVAAGRTERLPWDRARVRVVHRGDGKPAPFATVLAVPPDYQRHADERFDRVAMPDPIERLRAIGAKTQADASGIAVIRRNDWSFVVGEHDGQLGTCRVEGPEPEGGFLLELEPDRDVEVRVVTADGRPAGDVRLSLRGMAREGSGAIRAAGPAAANGTSATPADAVPATAPAPATAPIEPEEPDVTDLAHTDATGIARLRHIQAHRRYVDGRVLTDARITIAEPGLESVGVGLDLESVPDGPIEIRLPPCGSLRAVVVNVDGTVDEAVNSVLLVGRPDSWNDRRHRRMRQGSVVYPFVALGGDYSGILLDDYCVGVVAGPRSVGEEVRLSLRLSADATRFRLRALDQDQRPIERGTVHWSLRWSDGGGEESTRLTNGSTTMRIDQRLADKSVDLVLGVTDGTSRGPALFAKVDAVRIVGDSRDLGDVVFRPLPEFARGAIVGPDPLPRVEFTYEREVVGADGSVEWRSADEVGTVFGPDGSFRIVSAAPEPVRLKVECAGCEPVEPILVRAGDDVRIRLVVAAELVVRMHADPRLLQHAELVVVETRRVGASAWTASEPMRQGDLIVCRCADLMAGEHSVRVRTLGDPDPVVQVDGVVVAQGELVDDPRLQSIDLRGRVHVVRLGLVDVAGRRIESYADCVVARLDRVEDEERWFDDGLCWWACAKEVDVVVHPDEGQAVRYRGPARDADIQVEAPVKVAFRVACTVALPADHFWLVSGPRQSDPPDLLSAFGILSEPEVEAYVGSGEAEVVAVNSPGNFLVELVLVHVVDGAAARSPVLQTRTLALFQDGEQRFEVSAEDARRALAELNRPR